VTTNGQVGYRHSSRAVVEHIPQGVQVPLDGARVRLELCIGNPRPATEQAAVQTRSSEEVIMSRRNLASLIVAAVAAFACSEERPVAPDGTHGMHNMMADVVPLALEPFTVRATLDPYRIHQLPDFSIHSNARTDIVIQRIVLSATSPFGMWHTHPGPSFVYVIEGEVRLDRFTEKDGCTQTPVSGPGKAYFEVANQVHRAVVVSTTPATLLVTRFNIPVGGAFTIPAADPGC
jgi:hypothetical protein